MSDEGITVNNTRYSPESIALMASQIATLQALVETQRAIIEDLGYQKAGLMMLVTDPAWARRWKRSAKRWRNTAKSLWRIVKRNTP